MAICSCGDILMSSEIFRQAMVLNGPLCCVRHDGHNVGDIVICDVLCLIMLSSHCGLGLLGGISLQAF